MDPVFAVFGVFHLYLLFSAGRFIFKRGPEPTDAYAGRGAADHPPDGPGRGADDLAASSLPEIFLPSRRLGSIIMGVVLLFDLAYLSFVLTERSLGLLASGLELHVSYWGALICSVYFAARFGDAGTPGRNAALAFAAALVHLSLTLLGHDKFAARSLAVVLALWTVFLAPGLWRRLAGPVLAGLYFVLEALIVKTGLYGSLSVLDWHRPLEGPLFAYDYSLKIASFEFSGFWGMGRDSLSGLGYLLPDHMHLNGLPYLTVMLGEIGVLAYAFLNIATLIVLSWFIFRRLSEGLAILLLPPWALLISDQYATLIYYLGWQAYGLTSGPAFIGGHEPGLAVIMLALAVFDPRSRKPRPAGLLATDWPGGAEEVEPKSRLAPGAPRPGGEE
jgi:hypothetical protein